MSLQSVIVPDIIRSIVEETAVLCGIDVKFMHGPEPEIEANLIELTNLQAIDGTTKKYPLIILFHDFPVVHGSGEGGYYGEVKFPRIAIVTMTSNTYKADKRYDETFKPILYPIYKAFLVCLTRSKYVTENDSKNLDHTTYDRLYWGVQKAGTKLNDYLDGIDIQNLKLTLKQFC